VILILLFGAIFSGSSSNSATVYVLNQDQGPLGSSFVQALNQSGVLKTVLAPPNVTFPQYLLNNSYPNGIVIPEDFSSKLLGRQPVNITVYTNPADSSSQLVAGVTAELADSYSLRLANVSSTLGVEQHNVTERYPEYIDFLIPGLIGFAILTSPMFSMVNISATYKKSKYFKQLSLTPLTKGEWLVSKILWYVLLSIISFALMVGTGILLFHATVRLSLWTIPFLTLGPLLFVSLGMLVGSVTKSEESAGVVGNIITFPMMFLSGTFFPINVMPAWLQTVAHVFPLYYITNGLTATMVYSNYSQSAFDSLVVALLSVILFFFAIRAFKWRED
jgi:ABC-2 type transport system permease protein